MDEKVRVRKSVYEDIPQIALLMKDLGYGMASLSQLEEVWKKIHSNSTMEILTAVTANEIAGYLSYSFKPQLRIQGEIMEIDELSVGEKYRGQGIGTVLLKHSIEIAQNIGVKRIILSTNKERESYKRGFYKKHGFQEKKSAWMALDVSR